MLGRVVESRQRVERHGCCRRREGPPALLGHRVEVVRPLVRRVHARVPSGGERAHCTLWRLRRNAVAAAAAQSAGRRPRRATREMASPPPLAWPAGASPSAWAAAEAPPSAWPAGASRTSWRGWRPLPAWRSARAPPRASGIGESAPRRRPAPPQRQRGGQWLRRRRLSRPRVPPAASSQRRQQHMDGTSARSACWCRTNTADPSPDRSTRAIRGSGCGAAAAGGADAAGDGVATTGAANG